MERIENLYIGHVRPRRLRWWHWVELVVLAPVALALLPGAWLFVVIRRRVLDLIDLDF